MAISTHGTTMRWRIPLSGHGAIVDSSTPFQMRKTSSYWAKIERKKGCRSPLVRGWSKSPRPEAARGHTRVSRKLDIRKIRFRTFCMTVSCPYVHNLTIVPVWIEGKQTTSTIKTKRRRVREVLTYSREEDRWIGHGCGERLRHCQWARSFSRTTTRRTSYRYARLSDPQCTADPMDAQRSSSEEEAERMAAWFYVAIQKGRRGRCHSFPIYNRANGPWTLGLRRA